MLTVACGFVMCSALLCVSLFPHLFTGSEAVWCVPRAIQETSAGPPRMNGMHLSKLSQCTFRQIHRLKGWLMYFMNFHKELRLDLKNDWNALSQLEHVRIRTVMYSG